MPPPDKKSGKGKTLLQSYLNTFNQQNEEPTPVISVKQDLDEDAETGVTYFVDEEGRYYYQSAGDDQNLVTIPTGDNEESDEIDGSQMLVDGEGYQTVTLVPSETSNGEVSYVLVVQEETTKPTVANIDIKQEKPNDDVYNFKVEDEDGAQEQSDDDSKDKAKTANTKRAKHMRPYFTCNFCSYTSHRRDGNRVEEWKEHDCMYHSKKPEL